MSDKLFYVVLSYYSRNTNHKKDTPTITVYFIFTFLFFCLLMDVFIAGSLFVKFPKSIQMSKFHLLILGSFCAALVYLVYYWRGRYLRIYRFHRQNEFLNSISGRRFYWTLLIILLTSPISLALLINKFVHGYWVH